MWFDKVFKVVHDTWKGNSSKNKTRFNDGYYHNRVVLIVGEIAIYSRDNVDSTFLIIFFRCILLLLWLIYLLGIKIDRVFFPYCKCFLRFLLISMSTYLPSFMIPFFCRLLKNLIKFSNGSANNSDLLFSSLNRTLPNTLRRPGKIAKPNVVVSMITNNVVGTV